MPMVPSFVLCHVLVRPLRDIYLCFFISTLHCYLFPSSLLGDCFNRSRLLMSVNNKLFYLEKSSKKYQAI